ncbi:MAG: response regulator transcription factor [Thermodesulfovibrionales bacterium]
MVIKLVIGCCNYLFGEGLKKLLEDDKDINVIGIFDESADLKEIVKLNANMVLADRGVFHGLPENFVIENPIKILLIADRTWLPTAYKDLPKMISRGVVGILPPSTDSALLKKALKAVSQGELWIERKTLKDMLTSKNLSEKMVDLTRKEEEITSLICQGFRNKEIAQKLNISEQTIKSHCNRIYKKIGVSDRLQLALYAYKIWPEYIPNVLKQK